MFTVIGCWKVAPAGLVMQLSAVPTALNQWPLVHAQSDMTTLTDDKVFMGGFGVNTMPSPSSAKA
jgi:hypothetical protein